MDIFQVPKPNLGIWAPLAKAKLADLRTEEAYMIATDGERSEGVWWEATTSKLLAERLPWVAEREASSVRKRWPTVSIKLGDDERRGSKAMTS